MGKPRPIGAWEQTPRWRRERGSGDPLGKTSRGGGKEGDQQFNSSAAPKASAYPWSESSVGVAPDVPPGVKGMCFGSQPHRNP